MKQSTKRLNVRLTKAADAKLRKGKQYKRGDLRARLLSSLEAAKTVHISADTSGRDHLTSVSMSAAELRKLHEVARSRNTSLTSLINACLMSL